MQTTHKAEKTKTRIERSALPARAGSLRRIAGSTALWIFICIFAVDYFLISVRPLQYIRANGVVTADQEPLNDKLEYLYSAAVKPDVLIFGSSLPMVACFGADWKSSGQPAWPSNYGVRYTGSKYFDSLLSKSFHQPVQGYNLSLVGSMISDDFSIFKDILANKLHPKMVMLAIAPRDFMDNMVPSVAGSRITRLFSERSEGVRLSPNKTLSENSDQLLRHCWRFFKVRADYERTLEFLVCSALGRASNIFYAADGKHFDQTMLSQVKFDFDLKPLVDRDTGAECREADLEMYRMHYLPLNESRVVEEIGYLKQFLVTCKKNGVLAVVVNMPLHARNIQLLPAEKRQNLTAAIARACQEDGAQFIDFSGKQYPGNSYSDSVHLRPFASVRFFDDLVNAMQKDKALSNQIAIHLSGKSQQIARSSNLLQ